MHKNQCLVMRIRGKEDCICLLANINKTATHLSVIRNGKGVVKIYGWGGWFAQLGGGRFWGTERGGQNFSAQTSRGGQNFSAHTSRGGKILMHVIFKNKPTHPIRKF